MVRIVVDPTLLKGASNSFRQKAAELNHLAAEVARASRSLGWSTHHKLRVESEASKAHNQAVALSAQIEEMSRYLDQTAAAFLEADNYSVESLSHLPPSGGAPWWMNRMISLEESLSFLDYLPQVVKEMLANILRPIHPYLPAGVLSFITMPLLEKPDWIPGAPPSVPQSSQQEQPVAEHSGFSELLQKEYLEAIPETYVEHNVPYYSQKGLMYDNRTPTDWGCVPTSTSMVLDYWHDQDQHNKTLSPQGLLDLNIEDRDFTQGKGMGLDEIGDELFVLGYDSDLYKNSDKEKLLEAIKEGPVIAQVNLNMRTGGKDHAVVVTGFSEDGNNVMINDPWNDEGLSYTWEQFSSSWSADHGSYQNIFLTIGPK